MIADINKKKWQRDERRKLKDTELNSYLSNIIDHRGGVTEEEYAALAGVVAMIDARYFNEMHAAAKIMELKSQIEPNLSEEMAAALAVRKTG